VLPFVATTCLIRVTSCGFERQSRECKIQKENGCRSGSQRFCRHSKHNRATPQSRAVPFVIQFNEVFLNHRQSGAPVNSAHAFSSTPRRIFSARNWYFEVISGLESSSSSWSSCSCHCGCHCVTRTATVTKRFEIDASSLAMVRDVCGHVALGCRSFKVLRLSFHGAPKTSSELPSASLRTTQIRIQRKPPVIWVW
jgi:hypothetical protein